MGHTFSTSTLEKPDEMPFVLKNMLQMRKVFIGPFVELSHGPESLGEHLYASLKKNPSDEELLIEGETDRRITSGDFFHKCLGLATSLKNLGINRGDVVTLIGDNSINFNIAAIGTILIGAVMAPVDPTLKSYEFQHLLKMMEPKLILCQVDAIDEVRDAMEKLNSETPVIIVDAEEEVKQDYSRFEDLLVDVSVDDFCPSPCENPKEELIVIVCSSGTTGLPKGVGLAHSSILFQLGIASKLLPGGVLLHTSYFYWISGVLMMLVAVNYGLGRVLLRSSDPLMVLKATDTYKPAMAMLSPSLLGSVVNHELQEEYDLSSLKIIVSGGSALLKSVVDRTKEIMPKITLIQGYGASEVGGLATQAVPPTDILSAGTVCKNTEIKVIHVETGEPLGPNEEGEILVSSPAMMKGYVNNDEATRQSIDQGGWYHTGDIGHFNEKGVLYITGRAKELLKVENHQISPAEIEDVIASVPGVADVIVLGIPVDENSLPIALVVKRPDSDLCENDVIQAVQENLSEFKQLRAGVFFVDAIPRTSTGKLKRKDAQPVAEELYRNACQ